MQILITCPPMLGLLSELGPALDAACFRPVTPTVVQTLSEDQLEELVPQVDGWIAGDDPVTRRVLRAGRNGRLRAIVKWGIGVDNIDFAAAADLALPVANTPGMFGAEVADLAMGYVIALARDTFAIDRGVRAGAWPKPRGISLAGKLAAVVGLGDIGRSLARRMLASEMRVVAYDPYVDPRGVPDEVSRRSWPDGIDEADFLVLCCALTPKTRELVNRTILGSTKRGLRLVNVARGPLVDEQALTDALAEGRVHSAALDVFEQEPLPAVSLLRTLPNVIFGSHNGSNTTEAAMRASLRAIELLGQFLVTPSAR